VLRSVFTSINRSRLAGYRVVGLVHRSQKDPRQPRKSIQSKAAVAAV
jgi:hypothetical protein